MVNGFHLEQKTIQHRPLELEIEALQITAQLNSFKRHQFQFVHTAVSFQCHEYRLIMWKTAANGYF